MSKRTRLAPLVLLFAVSLSFGGCASPATPIPAADTATPEAAPPSPTPAPAEEIPPPDPEAASNIRFIEAVDGSTVKFYLNRIDVAFLEKIAFAAFGIQSPANVKEFGGGGDLIANPVGTGPYEFVEWVPDQTITLERWDDYWGDNARTQTMVYRVIIEPSARLLELQAGTIDGMDNLAPDDFEVAQEDSSITVYNRPKFNIGYLAINNDRPPFDQLEVRQAVHYAINKNAIIDALYPPTAEVATQWVPPGIFGHSEDVEGYPHDPEKARELLTEAGFPEGFETTLWVMPVSRGYYPNPDQVAQAMQADLAAVGIEAEIVTYDWGTFLPKVRAGEHDLCIMGWMADYADATNILDPFFKGAHQIPGSPHPEVVELLNEAASTLDRAERQAIYDQANELIHDLAISVPVVHNSAAFAWKEQVRGIAPSPLSTEYYATIHAPETDSLIFAHSGDAVGLDCADEADGESFLICRQILEGLVQFEPGTSNVVPALAESWEVSDDGLEWTFNLREGVKFHDGSVLDAEAVVFNWMRWWDAENPYHVGHTGKFVYFAYFFGGFRGE